MNSAEFDSLAYPGAWRLGERLVASALRHADRPALCVGGDRPTYRELFEQAARVTASLAAAGIPAGSRVAIFAHRSVIAYSAVIGTLLAGCTYVPLNTRFPPKRNSTMLEASDATAVVIESSCVMDFKGILGSAQDNLTLIVPDADKVIPELLVTIMTVKGGGAQYPGDGRSGLWIGGLRLDVINDVDPVEAAQVDEDVAPRALARSNDNCRDLADLVSDEILSFLLDEQREAGDIHQWYKHRYIGNNIGLSRIDRAIAAFVIRRFGATRTTLEVGAGIAQCSQFLALTGVRTAGLEASHAHFEMMKRLTARLAERFDTDLSKRFTAIRGSYPDEANPFINEKTIVIVPSLGSTLTTEQEIRVFDVLRRADGVILGARMFFRVRDTEVERDSLIKQIQERGFGEAEEILSWSDGSFGFVPDRIIILPKVF
ncbi:MAG: AMP-binding protein [Reyranella sp.]|uniref:AMP-binding protein n=1 Tax=Reyranella sp. TaxID=1929291 RepID=UPI003D0DEB51